jgi:hypothetical protein
MASYPQSVAYTRSFLLVQSLDHLTGLTGATPTVVISKAGAAFAAAGGTVTEIANGWYKIALTTTDTNTLGDLAFHVTATNADPNDFTDQVSDPVRGLGSPTAIPNAVAGAVGGLPLGDASGRVDIGKALGTAITLDANNVINVSTKYVGGTLQTARDIGASVLLSNGTGTGQVSFTSGILSVNVTKWSGTTVQGSIPPDASFIRSGTAQAGSSTTTIKLDSGASAVDNLYQNEIITLTGGTGVGQSALISSYVGSTKVATISSTWATTPDATTTFAIRGFGAVSSGGGTGITVADILDGSLSGHNTAGTVGHALTTADALPSATTITNGVLDAALSGHTTTGTTGAALGVLTATLPDTAPSVGSAPTLAQGIRAIYASLMGRKRAKSGSTVTVYNDNGTTALMTFTLDDPTNPTSSTRAT